MTDRINPHIAANIISLIYRLIGDKISLELQKESCFNMNNQFVTVKEYKSYSDYIEEHITEFIDIKELYDLEQLYMDSLKILIGYKDNEYWRELGQFYLAMKYYIGLKDEDCMLDMYTLRQIGFEMLYSLYRLDNQFVIKLNEDDKRIELIS